MDWINFKKPQRYLGNEHNVIKKSYFPGQVRICLCFPDLYELGMSNVGMKIIYGQLNSFEGIYCERVFMPDEDLYLYLTEKKKKLFSLETKTPLCDFEILGFNFGYELNFTNFLAMLSSGGVELRALERKDTIVLGGGIANPEGLAEFVDVFFLGEFEVQAEKFAEIIKRYKDKEERLRALAEIDGFYIPKFYDVYIKGNRFVFEKKYKHAKLPIRKVFVKDLDNSFFPVNWLTPHTAIVHDRAQIEIARGCPNECSFCQARCLYFPYRERGVERVLDLAKGVYKSSGYENLSLLSLSASNYSNIEKLVEEITAYFKDKCVGVSLPSLRIEDVVGRLYKSLRRIKKVSATFAVEAATETLRERINKKIDLNKLFEAARVLKSLNSRHIKLYFMFGLPYEEDSDLLAIGDFLRTLKAESRLKINLSINAFIPKPFSSFEDVDMESAQKLLKKKELILSNIPRDRDVKLSISNIRKSILEAVTSYADRSFSKVIYRAFCLGARFDSYDERFNYSVWREAFKQSGTSMEDYLQRKKDNFSFSHIEMK